MKLRTTIILMLIIYFAGFATGIYTLAPAPEHPEQVHESFLNSFIKSDDFAESFNVRLHQCIDFARENAARLVEFARKNSEQSDDSA